MTPDLPFPEPTAAELAARVRDGVVASEELVRAAFERIETTDGAIGAWEGGDRAEVLAAAEAMDDLRRRGRPLGALHGVPVALDAAISAGSAVAEKLREAGAVILGATRTGSGNAAPVRCPQAAGLVAGADGAGAAAAVSAGHCIAGIARQGERALAETASFCGVFGFLPTRGTISRRGCSVVSELLDRIGIFGRSLEDTAHLADCLAGFDATDPVSFNRPKPPMLRGARAAVPVEPAFAWFDFPEYESLSPDVRGGFAELVGMLGSQAERIEPPASFAEIGPHLAVLQVPAAQQAERAAALAMVEGADRFFEAFFKDYDAILAPAAPTVAPAPGEGNESAMLHTVWAFAGLPVLTLPFLSGADGLPVGIQLIGAAEEDDRLMRTAAWQQSRLFTSEFAARESEYEGGLI